jgi:hypothetical protein
MTQSARMTILTGGDEVRDLATGTLIGSINAIAENQKGTKMLPSVLQAQSKVHVPGVIAQIMSQAGLGPIVGKIGIPDLDSKLQSAGVHYKKRMELKAWLHDNGLLIPGPR